LSHNIFDNKIGECYIRLLRSINLINKENILLWDTQKNTEDEEKWVQKREELAKEIKENKIHNLK